MRFFRPCFIAGWLYPEALFRISTDEKIICLTFDDGPDPDSTPFLLDILARHNLNAVFFCCGSNAEKHPGLVQRILTDGHLVGNHGYSHFNGWLKSLSSYMHDIEKADPSTSYKLFRPPFGRLRLLQYFSLKKKYKLVFWDIMPYDFDNTWAPEDALKVLLKKIRPGSVIALHDSPGSSCKSFLEMFIVKAKERGYRFELPL
jgi:peptidoglycan/xylan/chitin deacetylase (PgdA/CDA1 family)